ncbi:unnamed protein product [Rhizophagus irregularis]|uniref:Transcription activator GCR1-like domain-containing protein n=1 Tax=Rhizophagus irregularis TaxID=588596 RepID=A0A2N1NWG1_9GLOM|nr:hypothetical protein RhiirC2_730310 [Rhizophagus irregularis]CAB4394538.1 unnamed protein product [Rhizophagus irregularis]CAB5379345.1 unnamed protein product [Rhizophagus irregularis]
MPKKSNNIQRNNQNKIKRKGRPPKKKKYVQPIDSSDEDILSARHASTRPRIISIRRNEIPMRPEIHIPPASIPSFNNPSNIQQSSSDRQMPPQVNEQQLSATTTTRITITMTSITKNSTDNSNTTTYVTTDILPINEMNVPSQLDNSENRLRVGASNLSTTPVNSSDNLNNLDPSNGPYTRTNALNSVTLTPATASSSRKIISPMGDLSGSRYHQTSNSSPNAIGSSSRHSNLAATHGSQLNDLRTNLYNMPGSSIYHSAASTDNSPSPTFIHTRNDMCDLDDSNNPPGNLTNSFPACYESQFSTGNNEFIATRPRYYRIPDIDTLDTVFDVWKEWNFGIGDNPSIVSLIETYGNKWQINNSGNLAARKKIIKMIKLRAVDIGLDKAIDEMEKIMGSNKLSWLADNFHGKKKIIEQE